MNNKKKRKGISLTHVCFESHLVDVPLNSWWIDIEASIHVTNFLQGFVEQWRPMQEEIDLFMKDGEEVKVEQIETVKLKLEI